MVTNLVEIFVTLCQDFPPSVPNKSNWKCFYCPVLDFKVSTVQSLSLETQMPFPKMGLGQVN
jgi:hypothetical protein